MTGVQTCALPISKDPPGRNDLMMAVYIPYCDQFITNDGPQEEALREVANKAEMPCKVRSFDDFEQMASH